jgi:DNA-binding PadR family transcriptional regulator
MDREFDAMSFHILLVLAGAPLHGYAVRQEVEARTEGAIRLWPATLYGALADLAKRGLIEESASPGGAEDDPRRRYYALTAAGRYVLAAEASRLESLAQLVRARLNPGEA